MSAVDLVLLAYLFIHTLTGLKRGLIHVVGSLIGMFFGAYIALNHSSALVAWFAKISGFNIEQLGKWVTFLIIFVVSSQLVGLLFWIAERSLGFLVRLPGIYSINHILGGILAFFEDAFIVGLAIYYAKYLPVPQLSHAITASKFAPWFVKTSQIFLPLIPDAIKKVMVGIL